LVGATRECNADALSVAAQLQETALEVSLSKKNMALNVPSMAVNDFTPSEQSAHENHPH
jgi:hypothetical protein